MTSSLSAHVTTTSETFYTKMADANAVFFDVKYMKIKRRRIKGVQEKESGAGKVRKDKSVPRDTASWC